MQSASDTLPTDVDGLTLLVKEQQTKIDQQSEFIESILEQIRLARQQHFGAHSERFNVDQLALLFNEAEVIAETEVDELADGDTDSPQAKEESACETQVAGYSRKKPGRRALPDHLPRVELIYDIDDADKVCKHGHGALKPIAQKVSEQLDIVRAQIRVIQNIRLQYACSRCDHSIKTAKLPPQPIPGSHATPGTLAHVAIGKFCDGLPLYRQSKQWERQDIHLPRSTLAHWMIKAGVLIQPLINLLRDLMLAGDYIALDETRTQVLKELGKSPQSQSQMWVQYGGYIDQTIILFDYDPSRSQDVPVRLLQDFCGYLQTDGFSGYNKVCESNGITQLGCWAHARRKFDEALKSQKLSSTKRKTSLSVTALHRIQLLYKLERQWKHLAPEERYRQRQLRAVPILTAFRQWLDKHLPLVPPRSALGKAMNYTHKQWDKLIVYTQDGRLRIDNNAVENAIRPFVIGRKNHLFSDTVAGTKSNANLYSLIETAKANGLEPYAYLKTVFTVLPQAQSVEDIEALLPFKPAAELEQAA